MKLKNILKWVPAAMAGLATWTNAAAPAGTAIGFQGRLNDGGQPANGIYDFIFVVYDTPTNDLPLVSGYPVPQVPVTNGLFAVQIDFGANVFTGGARWLETVVRTNDPSAEYTALTPRQALLPTPYALHAQTAATALTVSNVNWSAVTGVPASLADGVDNDTTYGAGAGLSLNGANQFSVNFSGNGSANTAARADHSHFGQEWVGTSNNAAGLRVQNRSASGIGLWAKNDEYGSGFSPFNGAGVFGDSSTDAGVAGFSNTGPGVYGWISALNGTYDAIRGDNPSTSGRGVFGHATATNGVNMGVLGVSESTSGRGVRGVANAIAGTTYGGVFENKSPSGAAVYARSDRSPAARFEITTTNTSSTVLEAAAYGTGSAGKFTIHNASSSADALIAQTSGRGDAIFASTVGSGNAANFQLTINYTNNAAVLANAIGTGTGVRAVSGTGTAIKAESAGTAISAKASGGTALEIDGGAVRVKGAGFNTPTAAFIHRCTDGNVTDLPGGNIITTIDHPMCNNNPNAMLHVTPRVNFDRFMATFTTYEDIAVAYRSDKGRWVIVNTSAYDELGDFDVGDTFNVFVFLP